MPLGPNMSATGSTTDSVGIALKSSLIVSEWAETIVSSMP
jgi:hypothetical protein